MAGGERTLFGRLPEARATNDLDLFLRAEVLADIKRTRHVADAILRLGYRVVEEAKYLQWKRPIRVAGVEQEVKIDVLVGPPGEFRSRLHIKLPRARPKESIPFHAYLVEEALGIEDMALAISIAGRLSNGNPYQGTVLVPHAFPYLMMKLHAFDDRKEDEDKDLGRHHALDLYTIVGLMTEREYEQALALSQEHAADPHVHHARKIIQECFANRISLGLLRLGEHPLFRDDFPLGDFMAVLREIFPS